MASEAGGPGPYPTLHDRLSRESGALWNDAIDATTGDQAQRVVALAMCSVHERLGEVVELLAQLVQDGRTPTVVRDLTDLVGELGANPDG